MEPRSSVRSTYHHGNLKTALIQATLGLIEEKGPDHVTVAEAAKRAGVSSGAPFRHFTSKLDLMTAVAEVLQAELLERLEKAHGEGLNDPWETLCQFGLTYMNWGLEQPSHFRTYSNRNLYAFESSPALLDGDQRLGGLVESTFLFVLPDTPERAERARRLNIHSRALLTGLVTLSCYGHFPRFGVNGEDPKITMKKSWLGFLRSVRLNLEGIPAEARDTNRFWSPPLSTE